MDDKTTVPEYNQIDVENDDLGVIEAKIEAIKKQQKEIMEKEEE